MNQPRHPAGTPPVAVAIDLESAEEAVARYLRVLDLKPRQLQLSEGPLTALRWLREQPDWPQDDLARHYDVLACGFPDSDPSRSSHWDQALKATFGIERNRMWQAIEARFRADLGPARFEQPGTSTERCLRSCLDCWYYAMIELVLPHTPAQPEAYIELVSALASLFDYGVWRLWILPEIILLAPRVSLPEPVKRPATRRSKNVKSSDDCPDGPNRQT